MAIFVGFVIKTINLDKNTKNIEFLCFAQKDVCCKITVRIPVSVAFSYSLMCLKSVYLSFQESKYEQINYCHKRCFLRGKQRVWALFTGS